jgi:hypothetical protein
MRFIYYYENNQAKIELTFLCKKNKSSLTYFNHHKWKKPYVDITVSSERLMVIREITNNIFGQNEWNYSLSNKNSSMT